MCKITEVIYVKCPECGRSKNAKYEITIIYSCKCIIVFLVDSFMRKGYSLLLYPTSWS